MLRPGWLLGVQYPKCRSYNIALNKPSDTGPKFVETTETGLPGIPSKGQGFQKNPIELSQLIWTITSSLQMVHLSVYHMQFENIVCKIIHKFIFANNRGFWK